MSFLPVVARELRLAARRRSTFWVRVSAALVALAIGAGCLVLGNVSGAGTAQMGGALFSILTWMSLAGALSAGLFFTSDCLSEEKREGTLGFLFLTDLRGYDVVGGKLLATSLRSAFALVALFPVLAVVLLMGGVTGAAFWKTNLALMNALFCSLAAGLAVSSISREGQKALAATVLVMLLWIFGGPIADELELVRGSRITPMLSLTSPGFVFKIASAWGHKPFWSGLMVSHLLGWVLLGLACFMAPRAWQDKGSSKHTGTSVVAYTLKYGTARRRRALRERLLSLNPVEWLACRERWQPAVVWLMALVAAGAFAFTLTSFHSGLSFASGLMSAVGGFFVLLLYLAIASHAPRFFIEARRSGLLELLMALPLDPRMIVRGQWRAMLRLFGAPALLLLMTSIGGAILMQQMAWGTAGGSAMVMGSSWLQFVSPLLGGLVSATNLAALGWFGMLMGLNSKSANIAALKTLLYTQIIPVIIIGFISGLVVALVAFPMAFSAAKTTKSGRGTSMVTTTNSVGGTVTVTTTIAGGAAWLPFVMSGVQAVLALAKDAVFILLSRRKLYQAYRELVVRGVSSARPPPASVPP